MMVYKNLVQLRNYCTKKSTFYVTTPIYYVNAAPHIGHLHSSVIADVVQRYQRILNPKISVKFVTGTDEHGQKIQKSAQAKNISIQDFCSNISKEYKNMADRFSVGYTDFIRTTDEAHKRTVQNFWKTIDKNGHIYSSQYVGWYCVSDEAFLTETQTKEVDSNGKKVRVSIESGNPVEWADEKNYMFRLSNLQEDLIHWLTKNENVVRPAKFHKILLDMISKDKLPDWSISRPSSRIHWGIKVPGDDTQTIHVWLDALVNYLTVASYSNPINSNFQEVWPPDVQVIGKDILKFHGIYWPAFLLAANLEPPKLLLCHSHWTVDGQKMSKSKNNVICPMKSSYDYTSDGLRYFLLHEDVTHSDGNYSDEKIGCILDAELANTVGNLLSRCSSKALNPNQVFPAIDLEAFQEIASKDVTKKLIELVASLPGECCQHYEEYNFHRVIGSVITTLQNANLFFETLKPWELKKAKKFQQLDVVLHITMETLRIASVILLPVIPSISQQILNKIRVPEDQRVWNSLGSLSWNNDDFTTRCLSEDKPVIFERVRSKEKTKVQN